MASSLVFLAWLKCLEKWGKREVLFLGLSLGFVVCSKINGYPTLLMTLLFLVFFLKKGIKENAKIVLVLLALAYVLSGWFFMWNYFTYGHPWPRYLIDAHMNDFMRQTPPEILKYTMQRPLNVFSVSSWASFFYFNFVSFWGLFGWMNIFMPKVNYFVAVGMSILSAAGMIREYFSVSLQGYFEKKKGTVFALMLLCVPLIFILSAYHSAQKEFSPQGRYFFPAIVPIAMLFSWGILSLSRNRFLQRGIFTFVVISLLALNISSYIYCHVRIFYR